MVVTIIGSMKFKEEMMEKYVEMSLNGIIVLLPVDIEVNSIDMDDTLMMLHKKKIDLADEIFVMNVGGYMGRGTYEEIGYATVKHKKIVYLEAI